MLWLHKKYSISSMVDITKKLTQQYVESFYVLEKVGKLAYCLNIFADWYIHNIFNIMQLKLASNPATDPFQRSRPNHLNSIFVEVDIDSYKFFEIKHLFNKHITKQSNWKKMQYLIC